MLLGYIRVSSDNDRQKTDHQKDSLIKYGVLQENIFEDRASGSRSDREGLERVLSLLKKGDTLVVWKLDRLGRSLSHLVKIMNDLNERGVQFKSITESIDTSTPIGKMMFGIMGTLAENERELIKERVVAGIDTARARGVIGGRRRVIEEEKLLSIIGHLSKGNSMKSTCSLYNVKRTTLLGYLKEKKGESTSFPPLRNRKNVEN